MKKKVVTIKKSKWRRTAKQVRAHGSALLQRDGMMCFLGFVCRALGASVGDIRGLTRLWMVNHYNHNLWQPPEWLAELEEPATEMNDTGKTTKEIERGLKSLFADSPVELRFVP